MLQDGATKWINRGQQVLEYRLDNSSSILPLTQTMAALPRLLKSLTMVTGDGGATGRGLLSHWILAAAWNNGVQSRASHLHFKLINPTLFIFNLDASMSPYNTFSIYIWPWGTVQICYSSAYIRGTRMYTEGTHTCHFATAKWRTGHTHGASRWQMAAYTCTHTHTHTHSHAQWRLLHARTNVCTHTHASFKTLLQGGEGLFQVVVIEIYECEECACWLQQIPPPFVRTLSPPSFPFSKAKASL